MIQTQTSNCIHKTAWLCPSQKWTIMQQTWVTRQTFPLHYAGIRWNKNRSFSYITPECYPQSSLSFFTIGKKFSRYHTQHNVYINSNSTYFLLKDTVDHKMKIKAARRRYLKPLEFYQFHLDTKTVSLTSKITFLEKDTLTGNPIWRSRGFTSETIITQNIQRKERDGLLSDVASP